MSDQFTILTVCTGNICRSPLAEQIFKMEFRDLDQITVRSAGLQAMVDHPMPEFSLKVSRQNGVVGGEQHRGQQLTEALLESADLVLAMDRGHRKAIVELSPRTTRRVFTVKDLARLIGVTSEADLQAEVIAAGDAPAERLRAAIDVARLGRSDLLSLDDPADEDVIDPYGLSEADYNYSASQLLPAVKAVASYLHFALEI